MDRAYHLAKKAGQEGEVPIGACVLDGDQWIGEGWNQMIQNHDPSAHAEIQALRMAALAKENYRLPGCILVVTLEPCLMCYQAARHARIATIIYGASDPKVGVFSKGLHTALPGNHVVLGEGPVDALRCGALLSDFFKARR